VTKIAVSQRELYQGMVELRDKLDDFKDWADKRFVSKQEFVPVQKVVYGLVGATSLAVLGALIAIVLKAP